MARARNIKPSFFSNDELAEIDPIGRILFIGLWTIADFKGDLVWREKRIKAQLLPYDNCDIKKLAINLDESGFVRFYSDGGKMYLNVRNFSKHQNPHKNEREKGSEIPEFNETMRQAIDLTKLTINLDKSGLNTNNSDTNRADSLNLIPDSLNLIPDSPKEIKPIVETKVSTAKANLPFELFSYWCDVMDKSISTSKLTPKREKAIKDRLKQGYTVEQIKTAIFNCSKDPFSMGKNDRGKKFNDLELICRSGEKIESFIDGVQHGKIKHDLNYVSTDFETLPPEFR